MTQIQEIFENEIKLLKRHNYYEENIENYLKKLSEVDQIIFGKMLTKGEIHNVSEKTLSKLRWESNFSDKFNFFVEEIEKIYPCLPFPADGRNWSYYWFESQEEMDLKLNDVQLQVEHSEFVNYTVFTLEDVRKFTALGDDEDDEEDIEAKDEELDAFEEVLSLSTKAESLKLINILKGNKKND